MSDLRVPTLATPVVVVCADGRTFTGTVFIPTYSSRHSGAMRAEEWLNEPGQFFAFRDADGTSFLINKRELLVLTVPSLSDVDDEEAEAELPRRRVIVECEDRRLEGVLVIDMPANLSRVLDYLNRPQAAFLTVRDGERHHLVQKERITRVIEVRE